MRHARVAYFEDGRPLRPEDVPLTPEGREEARAAAALLEGIQIDRLITSGLPRTLETARIVAPEIEPEIWPELREIEPGQLRDIPDDELERTFLSTWDGVVPGEARFLGGETIGSLLDRVLPAVERLLADSDWTWSSPCCTAASTERSSPTRSPASAPCSATSSSRPAVSTSSTSATTGSSGPSTPRLWT